MDNCRALFRDVYDGKCRDRFCLYEQGLWPETYDRWHEQGMPTTLPKAPLAGLDYTIIPEDLDVYRHLNILYPCYLPIYFQPLPSPAKILSEEENVRLELDGWGAKVKNTTTAASLPQHLDWPIKTIDDWEAYSAHFQGPIADRLPAAWPDVAERIREQTHGIVTLHTIGMFAFPREVMGFEPMMMAFFDNPELIERMLDDRLAFYFQLYEQPAKDTRPDIAFIWEDMCYVGGPLLSPALVRQYLLPRYKRLVRFFYDLGIRRVVVDSDGDCDLMIPIWREAEINGILPFEVKAGSDIDKLTSQWPDMVFIGGINKHEIAKGRAAIDRELQRRLAPTFRRGNYIPSLDHWIPPDISLQDFCYYRDRVLQWHLSP